MRRMLTDKLTKSIKEVVNAYNEGEFSTVTANPETTTETLTSIEIDGIGYAVSGGTEVSGTNDGTNWTSLTIGEDTYDIPQGGGGQGKLRLSYTSGPTAATEEAINAWLLNMPFLAYNAAQASILTGAGFTNVYTQNQGTEFEIQGYIGVIKDDNTLAVITTEKRTGTNTLVNRTNTNIIPTMKQVASKDFMITDARFRGYNTSLSTVQGQDPLENAFSTLTVCSIALIAGYQPTVTADSTKNFVLREGFTISINNPDPDTYQDQVTPPTTDGTYALNATVTDGLPTFSWATPTLNKTTETLTFTYSDNTTGTLTVVTDVTLS